MAKWDLRVRKLDFCPWECDLRRSEGDKGNTEISNKEEDERK